MPTTIGFEVKSPKSPFPLDRAVREESQEAGVGTVGP